MGGGGAWWARQAKDGWVKAARTQDYRSRAAFKLLQLQKDYRLIRTGDTILDLGAAPGGWSQVACEIVGPRGKVLGMDILPMQPIEGVSFIQGDFTDADVCRKIMEEAGQANVIISDMAPNLTGISSVDQEAASSLNQMVAEFSLGPALKPGGQLAMKIFRSPHTKGLLERLQTKFRNVKMSKPEASRSSSAEIYLVATGKLR